MISDLVINIRGKGYQAILILIECRLI